MAGGWSAAEGLDFVGDPDLYEVRYGALERAWEWDEDEEGREEATR